MVVPEFVPESIPAKYEEPDEADVERRRNGGIPENKRLYSIMAGIIIIEPVQEGVRRYPPVQVQVSRRPDFIDRYVNMEPTNWHELFFRSADRS